MTNLGDFIQHLRLDPDGGGIQTQTETESDGGGRPRVCDQGGLRQIGAAITAASHVTQWQGRGRKEGRMEGGMRGISWTDAVKKIQVPEDATGTSLATDGGPSLTPPAPPFVLFQLPDNLLCLFLEFLRINVHLWKRPMLRETPKEETKEAK